MKVSIGTDGVVRKQATTPAEVDRLKNEAAVLSVARHPGVVRLLGAEPGRMETRLVGGLFLASLSEEQGAALATTLADLHDIGVVHGAIDASHVLIDGRGRPVLCGFGSGATSVGPRDPRKFDDVAALAALLPDLKCPRAARRSARALAASLSEVRDKRHPGVTQVAQFPRRLARMATVAAISLAVAAWWHPHRPAHPRLASGEPTDQVVLGRWTCEATKLPAVLRPRTGTLWIWDRWPAPGDHVTVQVATRLSGAKTARVRSGPAGCDQLLVTTRGGGQTTLGPFWTRERARP